MIAVESLAGRSDIRGWLGALLGIRCLRVGIRISIRSRHNCCGPGTLAMVVVGVSGEMQNSLAGLKRACVQDASLIGDDYAFNRPVDDSTETPSHSGLARIS